MRKTPESGISVGYGEGIVDSGISEFYSPLEAERCRISYAPLRVKSGPGHYQRCEYGRGRELKEPDRQIHFLYIDTESCVIITYTLYVLCKLYQYSLSHLVSITGPPRGSHGAMALTNVSISSHFVFLEAVSQTKTFAHLKFKIFGRPQIYFTL